MRRFKQWLQFAVGISKVEANGLTILLPLMLLIILLPMFINKVTYSPVTFAQESRRLNQLIADLEIDSFHAPPPVYNFKLFDPNEVSVEALRSMGLKPATAKNWRKYLDHGGKFYSADDIGKIYGLSDSMVNMIKPYVKITSAATDQRVLHKKQPLYAITKERKKNKFTKPPLQPFDLNTADTITLKQIRGIGSVFSERIVRYRESLGGFVHKGQLKEVYGLKDTVLQRMDTLTFIDPAFAIRSLDINNISEKELGRHPYLSRKKASAIITYRFQHGSFQTFDDLYNIHLLDSLTIVKIAPYLKF